MQDGFESPLPAPEKESAGIFRHPAVDRGCHAAWRLPRCTCFFFADRRRPTSQLRRRNRDCRLATAEKAYAPKLQFGNFDMSRAESFLNQEVTYLAGDVLNSGDRTLSGIEAIIEFQDDMNQIALRETGRCYSGRRRSCRPERPRTFEDFVRPRSAHHGICKCPRCEVSGLQFARFWPVVIASALMDYNMVNSRPALHSARESLAASAPGICDQEWRIVRAADMLGFAPTNPATQSFRLQPFPCTTGYNRMRHSKGYSS